jgi:Xaa-Pro dipeptidase
VVGESIVTEQVRIAQLLDAQDKAAELFAEIEQRRLIVPGISERDASSAIRALALEMFDSRKHWHKRIVRSGPNTLQPYDENPPDRVIADDDVVFCDLGPVFADWEADFGRTFVMGDDPVKHRLRDDLPVVWQAGREFFDSHPEVTGEQLFAHMVQLGADTGWEFGGTIAGHLVGEFPHVKISGDDLEFYIAPGSDRPMRRLDRTGRECHWILEVHLVDRARQIGGFYEELLDIG